jgi:putative ABC transport system permease protein
MIPFRQIRALARLAVQTLATRKASSLVAIVGFAITTGVLLAVLVLSDALAGFWTPAARSDVAVVMGRDAFAEVNSRLPRDTTDRLAQAPGIAGVSAQLLVTSTLPRARDGQPVDVLVRGFVRGRAAGGAGFAIAQGRIFAPGLGQALAQTVRGLKIGQQVMLGTTPFTVTGIFSDGGGAHESEIWGDAAQIGAALGEPDQVSAVYVTLKNPAAFDGFAAYLDRMPDMGGSAVRESDYLRRQSQAYRALVLTPGLVLVAIMAVAAILAGVNTMQSTVLARLRELATLRAIGFSGFAVALEIVAEALLLGLIGGIAGVAAVTVMLDNVSAVMSIGLNAMALKLSVGTAAALESLGLALIAALLAGIWPAIRFSRINVADALRNS